LCFDPPIHERDDTTQTEHAQTDKADHTHHGFGILEHHENHVAVTTQTYKGKNQTQGLHGRTFLNAVVNHKRRAEGQSTVA
jgi:hypothetical protein